MPDRDRLLARIGLVQPPSCDVAGLRALHRAYVGAMPYDTLAIHLDEVVPLDLDALQDRVLTGGRGGYCFELNGLLAWLLEELGFEVERREARVGERGGEGPTNHLALVVGVPGSPERWLADAGLGEGWMEPLALVPGVQAGPGRLGWTLERLPGGWWVGHHPWGGFPGIEIADPVVGLDAFSPHHQRLSCDPASNFMAAFVVQRPADDRLTSLRARTLTVRGPLVEERRVLEDAADLARTLDDRFGVVLDPERIGRLWDRGLAQHDAWLAQRAAVSPG